MERARHTERKDTTKSHKFVPRSLTFGADLPQGGNSSSALTGLLHDMLKGWLIETINIKGDNYVMGFVAILDLNSTCIREIDDQWICVVNKIKSTSDEGGQLHNICIHFRAINLYQVLRGSRKYSRDWYNMVNRSQEWDEGSGGGE